MNPRARPRYGRPLGRLLAAGLLLAIAMTATLGVLWQRGILKRWAQARIVEFYLHQVEPHLPFRIEEIDVDASWRELLDGRISRLSAVLRWETARIRVAGPIDIARPSSNAPFYSVKFHPEATLELVPPLGADVASAERSSPLKLDLSLRASRDLARLESFDASIEAASFEWKPLSLKVLEPKGAATWKEGQARIQASFKSLDWAAAKDHLVKLTALSVSASGPLALNPFVAGPEIRVSWRGNGAEVLWGDTYLDLPLKLLPADGRIELGPKTGAPIGLVALDIGAGAGASSAHRAPVHLEATPHSLRWRVDRLPARELAAGLLAATGGGVGPFAPLARLAEIDLRAGSLSTEGMAELGPRGWRKGALPSIEGAVRLENASMQWRKARFAARGVKAELPFSTRRGIQGLVSADELYYRKLKARLDPAQLTLAPSGAHLMSGGGLKLRIAGPGGAPGLPLLIDGVPLRLGTVEGALGTDAGPFRLETSLDLAETPVEPLARSLCLTRGRIPPAWIRVEAPYLELTPDSIDPDAQVTVRLFDGTIRLEELGLFDLGTGAPEADFSLEFDGIQLDRLGEWLGFGEMTGTLKGYAHDVTFQGWLPTHFDFSIDAVPDGRWVEFSPEAMRNLVALFAGDAADSLPGIATNTFFGGISRRLGGYDVKYAGLSLFANDGKILLETHDLPDVYRMMKKHYIFWGHRFKMPLQSDRYPVVMDETGLTRVFGVMKRQIQALAERKAQQEALKNGKSIPDRREPQERQEHQEHEDEIDPSCFPPAF